MENDLKVVFHNRPCDDYLGLIPGNPYFYIKIEVAIEFAASFFVVSLKNCNDMFGFSLGLCYLCTRNIMQYGYFWIFQ